MSLEVSKIIRSRRRTIALQIKQDGCLIVRAPFYADKEQIQRLVFEKRAWVNRKKEIIKRKYGSVVQKEFVEGEEFLYLGQKYKLYLSERKRPALVLNDGFSLSKRYSGSRSRAFINWYRENACKKLKERVDFYACAAGVSYSRISITAARSRWGSCSVKGGLNFSWRLIMAPLRVVDYVAAHEIAHLTEKNHSKSFWSRVEAIYPGYQVSKKWLKDNGHLLTI